MLDHVRSILENIWTTITILHLDMHGEFSTAPADYWRYWHFDCGSLPTFSLADPLQMLSSFEKTWLVFTNTEHRLLSPSHPGRGVSRLNTPSSDVSISSFIRFPKHRPSTINDLPIGRKWPATLAPNKQSLLRLRPARAILAIRMRTNASAMGSAQSQTARTLRPGMRQPALLSPRQ